MTAYETRGANMRQGNAMESPVEQTSDRAKLNAQFKAKLESAGLAYYEIKVFGTIRCNVHVLCVGRDTAHKWGALLSQVFGVKASIVETVWPAKTNKGTCLRPTMHKGFLIGVRA